MPEQHDRAGISPTTMIALIVLPVLAVGIALAIFFMPGKPSRSGIHHRTAGFTTRIEPGQAADISAYLHHGDKFELRWRTDGPPLTFQYHVLDGHDDPDPTKARRGIEGFNIMTANHGGLHGVTLRNTSAVPIQVTAQARGTFEYLGRMPPTDRPAPRVRLPDNPDQSSSVARPK